MGIFDRFRRKSYDTDDVDDYYNEPKKRNPLVAILLGILSFLITLALLWLLFVGGRWVYRQVMNDDENKQTSTSQNQDDQSQSSKLNVENKESGNQSSGSSSGNNSGGGTTSSTNTDQTTGGSSGAQSGGSSNSGSQSGSGSTSQTPATGDDLPRTGDDGM